MPSRVRASIPLLKVLTLPRPALANECVQTNAAGQVVLEAKDPLARRHRAHGDVAAEVHAASGSAGAKAKAAPDPLWCPHDFAARSERPTPPSFASMVCRPSHLQLRPGGARWWCRKRSRKHPSRPPRKQSPLSERRTLRINARCDWAEVRSPVVRPELASDRSAVERSRCKQPRGSVRARRAGHAGRPGAGLARDRCALVLGRPQCGAAAGGVGRSVPYAAAFPRAHPLVQQDAPAA